MVCEGRAQRGRLGGRLTFAPTCARCGLPVRDAAEGPDFTAGFYLAPPAGYWQIFCAAPGVVICDDCMWATPLYRAVYGRLTPTEGHVSWGIAKLGVGAAAAEGMAAALVEQEKYGHNNEATREILAAIGALTTAFAKHFPDKVVSVETNGHVDPRFGGSASVSLRVWPA